MKRRQLIADEQAPRLALDELGWVGRDSQSPELQAQRDYLNTHNGIPGLEVLSPAEVERAASLFHRDGFVVIRDALDPEQLDLIRAGCDREIHQIVSRDRDRIGNRGSHRYSFGGASLTGHQMHHPEWAMLIDLPTVTPILSAIFGSSDYHARGGGGDFCLPGAVRYQPLHSDMSDRQTYTRADGTSFQHGSFLDHRGQLTYRDLPCPYVCCNFLMVDFTAENGPTRQIPGTQHSRTPIPTLDEEPEWMKLSTVCPAPAGSVLIRDVRAWHGGTPNLSGEVRAIPNAEFFAPWYREPVPASMPRNLFESLSEHGQRLCRHIVAEHDQTLAAGYRADLGRF
jgi:ectoine hydroxylase-related dioxygenase (phytanoyl-CoA dioxygenase family)